MEKVTRTAPLVFSLFCESPSPNLPIAIKKQFLFSFCIDLILLLLLLLSVHIRLINTHAPLLLLTWWKRYISWLITDQQLVLSFLSFSRRNIKDRKRVYYLKKTQKQRVNHHHQCWRRWAERKQLPAVVCIHVERPRTVFLVQEFVLFFKSESDGIRHGFASAWIKEDHFEGHANLFLELNINFAGFSRHGFISCCNNSHTKL